MAHYRSAGNVPPKRHTQHRSESGDLYREELMGEEGFSSDSSLLYHVGVPSAVLEARTWELPDQSTTPNEPLLPRHLKLHDLFPLSGGTAKDPTSSPDVASCSATATCASPTSSASRRRRCTATPPATSACSSSPAKACSRPCSGTCRSGRATT